MPKLKKRFFKDLRLKYFKFIYTQQELLSLMNHCAYHINAHRSLLYRFGTRPFIEGTKDINYATPTEILRELLEYQRIQKKVKTRLAFNNVITGTNLLVFQRENLKVLRDTLIRFSEGKDKGNKKLLFDKLTLNLYNTQEKIESLIVSITNKMEETERKQTKINNLLFSFLFTKSFVLKEFDKKRYYI